MFLECSQEALCEEVADLPHLQPEVSSKYLMVTEEWTRQGWRNPWKIPIRSHMRSYSTDICADFTAIQCEYLFLMWIVKSVYTHVYKWTSP